MKASLPRLDIPGRPLNRWRSWFRLAVFLSIGVIAFLSIRHLDGHALARALRHTRLPLLACAGLFALGQVACRAAVFHALILPVARIPWWRAQRLMVAVSAASAFVPGRAGEFLRAYWLKRDDNVAVATTVAVTAVEKSLELLCLLLLLGPLAYLFPHEAPWVKRAVLCAAGIAVALLGATALLATRPRPPRWLASFRDGLGIARRPSLLCRAAVLELASWLLDFGCLLSVMRAVGVTAPLGSGVLVLLAVNLAIAVPAVPGNLGTFELGAVMGLQPFGVSAELGLAVGLLYHLAQVIPLAGVAMVNIRFIVKK